MSIFLITAKVANDKLIKQLINYLQKQIRENKLPNNCTIVRQLVNVHIVQCTRIDLSNKR